MTSLLLRPMPGAGFTGRGQSARKGCPIDGPLGWYVPQVAGDFVAIGAAIPDYLWLCQEPSGNLATSIGGVLALTANASPGYQQSFSGWARKGVTLDGVTANQGFQTVSALLDLAVGQSAAMLTLAAFTPSAANTRTMTSLGSTTGNSINLTSPAGLLRPNSNGVSVNGTVAHGSNGVHQFCWFRNCASSQSGASTELETVLTTHSTVALTGQAKGLGRVANIPNAWIGWHAIYLSANAERDWAAELAKYRGG